MEGMIDNDKITGNWRLSFNGPGGQLPRMQLGQQFGTPTGHGFHPGVLIWSNLEVSGTENLKVFSYQYFSGSPEFYFPGMEWEFLGHFGRIPTTNL